MDKTIKIKKVSELINHLKKNGIDDPYLESDYQLKTNYGFVYEIKNGEVVFLPHDFRGQGLLISDKKEFKKLLKEDRFPIENPIKTIFEGESERLLELPSQVEHYKDYLNKSLKFEFTSITKESAQLYLKKVVGRTIKTVATNKEKLAIIVIFGHLIKEETNGSWLLLKRYGKYNPYYEPQILTRSNKVIMLSMSVMSLIKWKVTNLNSIFNDFTYQGIDLKIFKKQGELIKLN